MRYNYFALQAVERHDDKNLFFAFVVKASPMTNLVDKITGPGVVAANICKTKKHAEELVRYWNASFKANGNALF